MLLVGQVSVLCHTPGVPLARRVPRAVSGYMLLTGLPISAQQAYNAGLVSSLVQEEDLEAEIERVCRAIASKPRGSSAWGRSSTSANWSYRWTRLTRREGR